MSIVSLEFAGKYAVITGATRGIGRAAALELARRGAHVVCLGRTVGALEELDDEIQALDNGSAATLVPLDLNDGDAIDRLGAALYERWGYIDILVGNAGILGPLSPLAHVSVKAWQPVLDINVTANWRLLRSMDPLLRGSKAGRAVYVTSGAAWKARPFWGPYAISKAALDAMVTTYAAEVENTEIKVNLLSPGATATKMRAEAMPGENPDTLPTAQDVALSILMLCDDALERTGHVFDHRTQSFLELGAPVAVG